MAERLSDRSGVTGGLLGTDEFHFIRSNGDSPETFSSYKGLITEIVEALGLLQADTPANLTAGFTSTAFDAGTKTTGTFTPDPDNGNLQRAINGGAHILAPPSVAPGDALTMVIQYSNNGSAGVITTSGFTKVTGDAIPTTNGLEFMFYIAVINGFSHLAVTALQ